MRAWWQCRSLKFRLAAWFTAVASGILLGLTLVVYGLIDHRLHGEFDRQLRIDWDLIVAHLGLDVAGRIHWRSESPAAPGSSAYSATWFDIWSGDELLMKHWPSQIAQTPPISGEVNEAFYNLSLENGLSARARQHQTNIGNRTVTLRVFRDKSRLHATLQEILIGFGFTIPLAGFLAALGGYVMANRTLAPLSGMADQARQISSESLSRRLPNPNPHDELGQLATVFNQTLQRLQNSFETLRQFTADASHELRTPLTALRAVGEVGMRDADPAVLRETIGSMLEEAQRLNDLVDALLLLARVETGRSPLHLEPVPLDELLSEIRESVGVLAAEKRQTIKLHSNPPTVARADRILTRHALMNILHNAIRYSPEGTLVEIRSFRSNGSAVVEIADQGPGIAREHHEKIFERFFRIDKARSRDEGGVGLGLAIAKVSIQQQGGAIELESAVGKGSCFRVVLPAQPTIV